LQLPPLRKITIINLVIYSSLKFMKILPVLDDGILLRMLHFKVYLVYPRQSIAVHRWVL
jgi:hypothetical protein